MRINPKITAKLMGEEIGISQRNVQVHIKTFKSLGAVERVGTAKGGHWIVNDDGIVENIVENNDSIVDNIVENNGINVVQMQILELMRSNPKITTFSKNVTF